MSKKFIFQRGGRGVPGNSQLAGRETSAQRLQTAWRAHACRWPLSRVPWCCVRIAATLRALLLSLRLARIARHALARKHVRDFDPLCGPRLQEADGRFAEGFVSGAVCVRAAL